MGKPTHVKCRKDTPSVAGLKETTSVAIDERIDTETVQTACSNADPQTEATELGLVDTSVTALKEAQNAFLDALSSNTDHPVLKIDDLVRAIGLTRDRCMLKIKPSSGTEAQYFLYADDGTPIIHENRTHFPFVPTTETLNVILRTRDVSLTQRRPFDYELL